MFSKKYAKPIATAIIVAAGDSRRMGEGVNKQFLLLITISGLKVKNISTAKKWKCEI